MKIKTSADENIEMLRQKLHADDSFDLVYRTIQVCGRTACMIFVDGLVKDEITEKIMEFFFSVDNKDFMRDAHTFSKNCVPYFEVDLADETDKICTQVLCGVTALIVDGFDRCILIDTRTYPQRETSEPEKDKVLRGSKDGFVETLVFNTALIRRRIRDTDLTMKYFSVGTVSKTDVVVCYMKNRVDKVLLAKLCKAIKNTKVESLTMNQQSLIEAVYKHSWINPFPKIKYSERPDTASSAVLEGNIVILVDNSPSVLILPTSIFDIVEEADDYYFPPMTGTYIRFTRYIVCLATLVLTPLWLLLLQNPQFVPPSFEFLLLSKDSNIPIFWQIIILEIAIDGLRLASLNTPDSLSTSLSVIAGIALSDFAVSVGWFSEEALFYMAFVAIANYSQPSYELGYALKFMRILLLIMTALFNVWGFVLGLVAVFLLVLTNKTVSGKSYLYPLIPFNGKELMKKVFRLRLKGE
ncbi:MAG: spore germination protein [Lachnospiraceae bacterium]|nr:spore germination protein [Lachnospiraceae bacterium]